MTNSWQIRHLRGSYGATWRLLPLQISPIYCRVSYVTVTRIPSLVLRNTWHHVIIRYSYKELPINLSYVAHTRQLYAKVWPRYYAVVTPSRKSSLRIKEPHFREIELDVTISWQLRGLGGCYGIYVAVTVSAFSSFSWKIAWRGSYQGRIQDFHLGGGGGAKDYVPIRTIYIYERKTELTFSRGPGPAQGPWKL